MPRRCGRQCERASGSITVAGAQVASTPSVSRAVFFSHTSRCRTMHKCSTPTAATGPTCNEGASGGAAQSASMLTVQCRVSVRGALCLPSSLLKPLQRRYTANVSNRDIVLCYVGAMHCCKAPLWGGRLDLDSLKGSSGYCCPIPHKGTGPIWYTCSACDTPPGLLGFLFTSTSIYDFPTEFFG